MSFVYYPVLKIGVYVWGTETVPVLLVSGWGLIVSLKHSDFFFMWGDGRIHQVNDPKYDGPVDCHSCHMRKWKEICILIVTNLRGSCCFAHNGDVWLGKEGSSRNMHKPFISTTNYSCHCLCCGTSLLSLPLLVPVRVQVLILQRMSLSVLCQWKHLNPYVSNSKFMVKQITKFECIL
jgi:hypothetical protein